MLLLADAWKVILPLLENGISLIPIRDKDDENGVAKSPYGKTWKPYTKKIITSDELWHDMDRFDTTAIGIICGEISGNLEAIDIDEKYMPGISARVINDIKDLYPEIYTKLRIHKTPSNGFHLIYRCVDAVDGNMKLAGRYANEADLIKNPKTKTYNFLETRGNNGYIAAPPSVGYSVVKDSPIETVTLIERNALINLCRSYTFITEATATPYKPTKSDNDYYDTNPFDDFNNRCNPSDLMSELGWHEYKHNNHFVWYTRPDKSKGVSMSFNINRRFFFCFTASTELQENKGYTPANLVAALLHNGDKKQTYRYLTNKGYGVIKPQKEDNIVKKAAVNNKPLPANASTAAVSLHAAVSAKLKEVHPYGTFWKMDSDNEDNPIKISRELLYNVAFGLGFRYHKKEVVRIIDKFIHKIDERYFQDTIKAYITEDDCDLYTLIADSYEAFMQRNGTYTMTRLPILDTTSILSDTKHTCYKCFTNGILSITSDDIIFIEYDTVEGFIWHHKVQQRAYNRHTDGKYPDFINKAIVNPSATRPILGYLCHDYKDETTPFIIILTEQCPDPKQGGGSGKNVFCSLLNYTTSYTSKPASQTKMDEKFFQSWNGQRVFGISDAPAKFDFSFLKEPASGSLILKKLFKDEIEVSNADAPKFIIQTNYSFENVDGGLKRRMIPLEFTDFFTKCGGLDVHYKAHFPLEWTIEDWGSFDTYIAECIQIWMKENRKLVAIELTDTGLEKQFRLAYGNNAIDFIEQNIVEWCEKSFISNDTWGQSLASFYKENDVSQKYHITSKKLYEAVGIYCSKIGYEFTNNVNGRIPGILDVAKGKLFKNKM